ncbi:MAG TPA: hypothetical protein VK828_09485 [Terriglobales bacterium]|jgi:hypothetical protein|nr:hypothetical protein [Terriglobales bacterium]
MRTLTKDRALCGAHPETLSLRCLGAGAKSLLLALLAGAMMLSACGSASSGGGSQIPLTLSGNWQFTMAPPSDGSFLGGLQGGFLLQNNGSVTGAVTYTVSLPQLLIPCSTGSAAISGTINSQNMWTLTAVAGTQTFTLQGAQSLDSSTMAGTYTSTAGTSGDGAPCGTAQTGLQWSAVLVPPLAGPIQGNFHSTGGAAGLNEQDFVVSGSITQAANTGASTTALTGNLNFLNSLTNASDYPCFTFASLSGQISGNSVTLQITGSDGAEWGLIGEPVGSLGATGVNPVTLDSVKGGFVLQGAGPSYSVVTTSCPGNLGSITTAGDFGNICLALNGTAACQQPITLTPSALTFPSQTVGSPLTTQTITLANVSASIMGGVTLTLTNSSGPQNFTETDTCGLEGVSSQGQPFDLYPQQPCVITIAFTPLENCAAGTIAAQCLTATLTVTSPNNDEVFTLPITGGVIINAASTPRLNFDPEGVSQAGLPPLSSVTQPWRASGATLASLSNRLAGRGAHAEID